MGKRVERFPDAVLKKWWVVIILLCGIFVHADAHALTINVVDDNGKPITNGFRWLVEEDNSYHVVPGQANPTPGVPESHTLGVNIHHSYAPVIATGDTSPDQGQTASTALASATVDLPQDKRYIVSVLPWHSSPPGTPAFAQTGWTMSGRDIDLNQNSVTIVVHSFPMPTAQITTYVFEDNQPINAALDQTEEHGLGGFDLQVKDIIGKVIQDAWGNPLGTTYKYKCYAADGLRPAAVDANGNCTQTPLNPEQQPVYQIDPQSGAPVVDYMGNGVITSCAGDTTDHPYPDSWSPYEMANCVDPYSVITRNGKTLLAPMGTGEAVIRYIPMNHYTVEPIPPGNDPDWFLTNTLEGGRNNDAWVRAAEPRYNIALGQLNWLDFFGFVKACNALNTGKACHGLTTPPLTTPPGLDSYTIKGQVVYAHDQHPPLSPGLSPGEPVQDCFVGLNNLSGADEQVYTAACNPDSTFEIDNVPPGTYQLVMWDKPVDAIIDFRTITVPATTSAASTVIDMGKVPIYRWFGTYIGKVFADTERNGKAWDASGNQKAGIPNILVNVHFSDGSMAYSTTTDPAGNFSISEFFPFWRFLVAEIDPGRFKPTGMTAVTDDGGDLSNNNVYPGSGQSYSAMGMYPQIQPDGLPYRTESGTVRTEAIQLYQDMISRIDWGLDDFKPNETGGIAGFVSYDLTRTEEDPAQDVVDGWEPGVPRVQVNLYQDLTGTGQLLPGQLPMKTTFTDSWDDNNPTGCVGQPGTAWGNPQIVNGVAIKDCAETFKTWNQIRPGVFDGAYEFEDLAAGKYIVQVVPPKGFKVRFWGDRDIEFGDPKVPFLEPPPECVGDMTPVPQYHVLFPDQQVPTDYPGGWSPGLKAPACDRKWVDLTNRKTFVVNFGIFTDVPKASRAWGTVWNDLMLEYNPKSVNAGGNLAVSWLPVSIKDYKGVEIARTYTDQWGHFEAMVPSNYDIAPPIPLGLVVEQYTIFPNDPGPILDTRAGSPTQGQMITDPFFNPAYSQEVIRENWDFYTGKTTFIDTIVLPNSAFVANRVPLNCDYADHSPEIYRVDGPTGGPLVSATDGDRITIQAIGQVSVNNPDFNPDLPAGPTNPAKITRDHGFGAIPGSVTVGGVPLVDLKWAVDGGTISAVVPPGIKTGQLLVTRGDNGKSTTVGVTLHVNSPNIPVIRVYPPPAVCKTEAGGVTTPDGKSCRPIQDAIDTAPNGALILISPGSYMENLILWKPVQLQGYGAESTVIDNTLATANFPLKDYQFNEVQTLNTNGDISVIPGQPNDFVLEQGAGILVASCDPSTQTATVCTHNFSVANARPLIDGLTITGSTEAGGGVLVNGYAKGLRITNDEIFANQGSIGGGIRLGTGSIGDATNLTGSSFNPDIVMDHNRISQNGSLFSGGGGIAIYSGADNYRVTNNFICGNFSAQYGGGIGHFGLSDGGLIANNQIVSNESFDEGGGVHIGGDLLPAAANIPQQTTYGSGSVIINDNLVQGNKAGDDGGGIRTLKVNGADVQLNPTDPSKWYEIDIFNNMVVNNSSADHGGGMSFDDTAKLFVVNNTVANNDSTSTGSGAFGGPCTEFETTIPGQFCPPAEPEGFGGLVNSVPQVAGIASFAHSTELYSAISAAGGFCSNPANAGSPVCAAYSDPVLQDDIVWHNRSYYWDASLNNNLGGLVSIADILTNTKKTPYWDMAVYGMPTITLMSPTYSLLTDGIGAVPDASNLLGLTAGVDPQFVAPYLNVYEATSKGAALGNFVTATFTPNGLRGDYHVALTSSAIDNGGSSVFSGSAHPTLLATDFDGRPRPLGVAVDIGASEMMRSDAPVLQLQATSLDFGKETRFQPVQKTVQITNNGQENLIVAGATTDSAVFSVLNWTGLTTVAPGGTMTITVSFTPTTAGPQSGTLTIVSNTGVPAHVSLSGTGI